MLKESRIFGLFLVSEAWKSRLSPYRLKATLAEVTLRGGVFAVFTSENCDPDRGVITADVWKHGGWVPTEIRDLDVVTFYGGAPVLRRQREVFRWLSDSFPVVRAKGPDKAQLPNFLQSSPAAERIIPQEVLEPDDVKASLVSAMQRYGSIVVKLAASSSGRGVRFITGEEQTWTVRGGGKSAAGTMEEMAELVALDLGSRAGYRAVIVQKFIKSSTPDGRALQLRVDVSKNGSGNWHVLRAFVHMAETGELASNIAFGGYLGSLERAMMQRSVRLPSDIIEDALALALNTAKALDAHPDVSIFELGIDMLIDEQDRIWLLEANLQPETTSYELQRAEFAVDYALAVASGALPAKRHKDVLDE